MTQQKTLACALSRLFDLFYFVNSGPAEMAQRRKGDDILRPDQIVFLPPDAVEFAVRLAIPFKVSLTVVEELVPKEGSSREEAVDLALEQVWREIESRDSRNRTLVFVGRPVLNAAIARRIARERGIIPDSPRSWFLGDGEAFLLKTKSVEFFQ